MFTQFTIGISIHLQMDSTIGRKRVKGEQTKPTQTDKPTNKKVYTLTVFRSAHQRKIITLECTNGHLSLSAPSTKY